MDAESNFDTDEIGAEAGVIGKMLDDATHSPEAQAVAPMKTVGKLKIRWLKRPLNI